MSGSRWARPLPRRAEATFVGGIVAVQVVVGAIISLHSYFFADDFLFFELAREQRFDLDYLRRSAFGHLIPVFQGTNMAMAQLDPIDYRVAVLLMVGFHLACTLAMWRLLRRVVGPTPIMALGLAVFGLNIIMFNGVVWWGASLSLLPSTAANVAAFASFVAWDRTRHHRWLVALGASYLLAMMGWEKSALTAVWIATYAVLVIDQGTGIRERVASAARRWPAWTVLGGLGGAYLTLYLSGSYIDETYAAPSAGQLGKFLGLSAFEGLFPPLLGIRYPAVRPFGVAWLGWVLPTVAVLALVVWTVRRATAARAAWGWFVVVYLANQLVLGRARIGLSGVHVGREYRYQIDDLYLFVVAAAVATLAAITTPAPSPTISTRRVVPAGWRHVVLPIVAVGAVVMWIASLQVIVAETPGSDVRKFFDNFDRSYDAAVASGEAPALIDRALPEWVILQNFYPYSLASVAIGQVRSDVTFTTSPEGFVIDDSGTIQPAAFSAARRAVVDAGTCGPSGSTVPFEVEPLESREWFLLVRFDTTTSGKVFANVTTPDGTAAFNGTGVAVAVSDADEVLLTGTVSAPIGGLVVAETAGACVTSVEIGTVEIRG